MYNPTPEIKRGFFFVVLILAWMIYLFFDPISALATAAFLVAAIIISFKTF